MKNDDIVASIAGTIIFYFFIGMFVMAWRHDEGDRNAKTLAAWVFFYPLLLFLYACVGFIQVVRNILKGD